MDVLIIATKNCSHCTNLSKELDDLGINHRVVYAEDDAELCQRLEIRHSPNLVIDGEVIFRRQPTEEELGAIFNTNLTEG